MTGIKRKFNIVFQAINFQDFRELLVSRRVFLGGVFVVFGLVKNGCCWSRWSASTWPEAVSLLPGLNISFIALGGQLYIMKHMIVIYTYIYIYIFISIYIPIYVRVQGGADTSLRQLKTGTGGSNQGNLISSLGEPSYGWRSLHNLLWSLNHLLHDLHIPTTTTTWHPPTTTNDLCQNLDSKKTSSEGENLPETWEFVFMYTRLRFRSSYH